MSCYPTKILLAVDGSDCSRAAADHAIAIAGATGSELHVIHVGLLSQWIHPDTLSRTQYQRLKSEAQKRFDAELKELEGRGAEIKATYLRMGRVDGEIIRLSEEIGAGLVVIGNRGVGALERILLGNDAESVVRHAPCPVLVVRPG